MSSFPILPNQESAVKPAVPSLDSLCQSSTSSTSFSKSEWSRPQKRFCNRGYAFNRIVQFKGYQRLWVTLTTADGGSYENLSAHREELERRVKRTFGYDVLSIWVKTFEGNGVLHVIWAIKCNLAVWIPQAWLSDQWLDIHGARVAHIKRIGGRVKDGKNVVLYMVTQYMAGQGLFDRYGYSWKKLGIALASSWRVFKQNSCHALYYWHFRDDSFLRPPIERWEWYNSWEDLITLGECIVGETFFFVENGHVGCF